LQDEVLIENDFGLLSIEDDRILAGLTYVTLHNLNSNDAAILATYLRYKRSLPPGSPACVLAASDQRLLRAASAEGLAVMNPELLPPKDIGEFFDNLG
jgi:predicted nucleic acid-binding protein